MQRLTKYIPGVTIFWGFMIAICFSSCNPENTSSNKLELWYEQPAKEWTDALPIGNGRLGAMVFGGVDKDHIQFNEASFWTGGPRDYNKKNAAQYLPQIRKLLFEGKQDKAEAIAQKHFMGKKRHENVYDSLFTNWLKEVRSPEKLAPVKPDFDDSHWKKIKVPTPDGFERVVSDMEGENGAFWFRTQFDLPENWQGKSLILDLGNVRDIDFTYVNGHFLGSEKSKWDIRTYTIPAKFLHDKGNVITVQVINPDDKGGLAGYHFTDDKKP